MAATAPLREVVFVRVEAVVKGASVHLVRCQNVMSFVRVCVFIDFDMLFGCFCACLSQPLCHFPCRLVVNCFLSCLLCFARCSVV